MMRTKLLQVRTHERTLGMKMPTEFTVIVRAELGRKSYATWSRCSLMSQLIGHEGDSTLR